MKKNNIIQFNYPDRILKKAKGYIDSVETLLEDPDKAVPMLINAINYADDRVKHHIIILLGSLSRKDVLLPLYNIISNATDSDDIRRYAAIQFSVVASFVPPPGEIVNQLLNDLCSSDAFIRANSVLALGWESNFIAVEPLIRLLNDEDYDVQQSAVNALCNIGDDQLMAPLLKKLNTGPLEIKRSILLNLWRFSSQKQQIISVYLEYMNDASDDLRMDVLTGMGMVTRPDDYVEYYIRCLKDSYSKIRELALKRLASLPLDRLSSIKSEFFMLTKDPDNHVRRHVIRILKMIKWDIIYDD